MPIPTCRQLPVACLCLEPSVWREVPAYCWVGGAGCYRLDGKLAVPRMLFIGLFKEMSDTVMMHILAEHRACTYIFCRKLAAYGPS